MLPLSYIKLDYIESTDTQYIDTGVVADSGTIYEMEARETHPITGDSAILGSSEGQGGLCEVFLTYVSDEYIYYSMSWGNVGSGRIMIDASDTGYHFFKVVITPDDRFKMTQYMDEHYFQSILAPTFSNRSVWLFGGFYHNSSEDSDEYKGSRARIRYCKFWQNGLLIRDFVPALRRSDKKPGLYDLVNDVFYTNQGTGEFLYELKYNSRIKANGGWRDSTALIKNNGEWKTATPLVKNTTWKQA